MQAVIQAVVKFFGSLFRRTLSPPDLVLFDRYNEQLDRVIKRLEECEDRHYQRDVQAAKDLPAAAEDRQRLSREIADLREIINELEWLRLVGNVCCDDDGVIVSANAAFGTLSGYTVADLVGMCILELIPYRYRARHMQRFAHVLHHPNEISKELIKGAILRRDGQEMATTITLTTWHEDSKTRFGAEFKRR